MIDAEWLEARLRAAADEERDCAQAQDFWHEELLRDAADYIAADRAKTADVGAVLHSPGSLGRDWPEDFAHENGCYLCCCADCGKPFYGYKRRVTCKGCSSATPPAEAINRAKAEAYEKAAKVADKVLRQHEDMDGPRQSVAAAIRALASKEAPR